MEPVSAGASVIAFIQLTASIIKLCNETLDAVKDAPQVVTMIQSEITSLKSILDGYTAEIDTIGAFTRCKELVNKLQKLFPESEVVQKEGAKARAAIALHWLRNKSDAQRLLANISVQKATMLLAMSENTSRDVHEIKLLVRELGDNLTTQERDKICDWIEMTNPTSLHHKSVRHHDPDTSEWVFNTPEWIKWVDRMSPDRFVWLSGIPGAGKTVLMSFLIEHVQALYSGAERLAVIYYYCLYSHEQDDMEPFLRWLTSQLIRKARVVPDNIKQLYQQRHYPSTKSLEIAIETLLEKFDVVYILVDAIDESQETKNIAEILAKLGTDSAFQKIRLFASSQKDKGIPVLFKGVATELSMSHPELRKDIQKYVHNVLPKSKLARFKDLWPEIEERLTQQADGMFRLAVCQLDLLQRQRCEDAVQAVLISLPTTIYDAYIRIFQAIPEEQQQFVRSALAMICGHSIGFDSHPYSVLFVSVLLPCIKFDLGDGTNTNSPFWYNTDDLEEFCGCLINLRFYDGEDFSQASSELSSSEVSTSELPTSEQPTSEQPTSEPYGWEPRKTVVTLAHYTVREFLESPTIQKSPAHSFALSPLPVLTAYCLNILRRACEINVTEVCNQCIAPGQKNLISIWNTDIYLVHFVLSFIASGLYPLLSNHSSVEVMPNYRAKILSLVMQFLHPESAPMSLILYLTSHSREFRADIIQQSSVFGDGLDIAYWNRNNERSFIFQTIHEIILTPITPELFIIVQLFCHRNIRLGLELLDFISEDDCLSVLKEEFRMRSMRQNSGVFWSPAIDKPIWDLDCFGTLPEIIAETQFLINGMQTTTIPCLWDRLWLLIDQYPAALDPTSLLNHYIYSHCRDCVDPRFLESVPTPCCLLKKLLDFGANPNGCGMRMTPLQVATQRWDFDAIELLLERGADPNAIGVSGGKACLGWRTEYASWSSLRIYRLAPFESLYRFYCSCKAQILRPDESLLCSCGRPWRTLEPKFHRLVEHRDLQSERRVVIEDLLVSKGANEFTI